MTAVAVITVSTGDEQLLERCLPTIFDHAGGVDVDVVVVDNSSSGAASRLVRTRFPQVRSLTCDNHGFAHGNNLGYETTSAPYVLFLNPDTEILSGSLADLVAHLAARPHIGILGVRQVSASGELHPSMRRFPTPGRLLRQAVVPERWMPRTLGLRVLTPGGYDQEQRCDWTSGSFMLARRAALEAVGMLDERFFLYNEEMDLCLRVSRAGWTVEHSPLMTILHHAGRAGPDPRLAAQAAFAWRQYLAKNTDGAERGLCRAALLLHFGLRAAAALPGERARRRARVSALRAFATAAAPPFEEPPAQARRTSVGELSPAR